MGSGGTEWEVADVISASRSNQKTWFIGTGSQINALSPTYAGQIAFCTSTGSGYTVENIYQRDSSNSSWVALKIGTQLSTALSETEEIWIPAGSFTSATTNGAEITSRETSSNKVNYHYAGFDTTTSEIVWFTWTPPANWNAGTVRFKLYWTNTGGGSAETIDFDLAAVAFADDDALDTAVGTAQNVTDTWIAQNDLHITSFSSAITIAGSPAAGEEIHFKLSRDVASDDLTGDCDVIGVLLEYSVNDIGTT